MSITTASAPLSVRHSSDIGPTAHSADRPNPRPQPRAGASASVLAPRARSAAGGQRRGSLLRRRLAVGVLTAAVVGGALAVGFGVGHAGAELEGSMPSAPVYVVQPGDTLWVIAGRLAPTVDTAKAVAALRSASGGASLMPGQRISVPASLR